MGMFRDERNKLYLRNLEERYDIMKEKTKKNIYTSFIGEAKAYFRLLAYAEKAWFHLEMFPVTN